MEEQQKTRLRSLGYDEEIDLIENERCPFCKEPVKVEELRYSRSKAEYVVSGLCQKCQDSIFECSVLDVKDVLEN